MRRGFWIVLVGLGLTLIVGIIAWQIHRGPSPEEILARIETPPSPVRSPEEELASFRLAPGFRAELVAAEPLVVDPVAMDWDDAGRLYVVEMRGFMPDIDGTGEERAVGRVVVLEDRDADGRMDESRVFLDDLVLPRAIAVLPQGVLVGVPPDLILCTDHDEDMRCAEEERTRLLDYAIEPGNVEHRENALLPGLDGWIYNSKSSRRFRLREASDGSPVESRIEAEVGRTLFRGQWGLAQDDEGRLFYNHNSGFLYADLFPADYTLRQPGTAAAFGKHGVNVDLASDQQVFGVRVAPGLNRAYQPGTLRRDGRQNVTTAVSGLVIQRGDQYGPDYRGDAFVPESAGSAVAHFSIEEDTTSEASGPSLLATHRLYPDEEFGQREFLASTDERFRPVDAKVGPDGAVWLIDMYRGVIQHAHYVSDYLREYVAKHDLASPGATGRIWRIVREDRSIDYAPPSLETVDSQIEALDHPNGWVRDRAQRRLAASLEPGIAERLHAQRDASALGQRHALWTLAARGELSLPLLRERLRSEAAGVRRDALRAGESLLPQLSDVLEGEARRLLEDPDPGVRLQAIHTLGEIPEDARPLDLLIELARDADPLERQAALSGIGGLEEPALVRALASERPRDPIFVRALSTAVFFALHKREDAARAVAFLLDRIEPETSTDELAALAIVHGIQDAQELPDNERVTLAEPHPLFDVDPASPLGEALDNIRHGFTWPGDPSPGGARPLSNEEERLRQAGEGLYAATCVTCHGPDGRGAIGLAPPLVGSPWVRDTDEWIVRIVLQGVRGPIQIRDQLWNGVMPGHGHDPRFDDESLAGLATFLRRAWGHGDAPIAPATVGRIRAATADHPEAWTADELLALPVEHRLDRFAGTYRIPIVGIELVVARAGSRLEVGRSKGARAPMTEIRDSVFTGEGLHVQFDPSESGLVPGARVRFGSDSVHVSRVEP